MGWHQIWIPGQLQGVDCGGMAPNLDSREIPGWPAIGQGLKKNRGTFRSPCFFVIPEGCHHANGMIDELYTLFVYLEFMRLYLLAGNDL